MQREQLESKLESLLNQCNPKTTANEAVKLLGEYRRYNNQYKAMTGKYY